MIDSLLHTPETIRAHGRDLARLGGRGRNRINIRARRPRRGAHTR